MGGRMVGATACKTQCQFGMYVTVTCSFARQVPLPRVANPKQPSMPLINYRELQKQTNICLMSLISRARYEGALRTDVGCTEIEDLIGSTWKTQIVLGSE